MEPAVRRTLVDVDIGHRREAVGLVVHVTVLAARGEIPQALWAARAGELATRIGVWHISPLQNYLTWKALMRGLPRRGQRLKKSESLSLSHPAVIASQPLVKRAPVRNCRHSRASQLIPVRRLPV
jgi:hypothetical protein